MSQLSSRMVQNICKGKGKGKLHPTSRNEGPKGEQRYSSTLSLTSTPDGVVG